MTENSHNRLKFFPIMMFATVMGLSGLTIVYQKAHEILGFSRIYGDILVIIVSLLFLFVLITYIYKFFKFPQAVKKEFAHPIRINFFAAISISFILLSIIYRDLDSTISYFSQLLGLDNIQPTFKLTASYSYWLFGTVVQTFFTFYTLSFWINHNQEIHHSNPAWLIPIVGNVLVPVAGAGLVDTYILMFYFSVGMFFWLILSAILFNRIIFHDQMAQKFIPTLFILIAPPAIGVIAYIKMGGSFDIFAQILYNLAIFFTLLLAFMYKNFIKIKFFISWWAFTFPLAAVTIASLLAFKITHLALYKFFSYLFLYTTTIVVLIVIYQTIKNIKAKTICQPE